MMKAQYKNTEMTNAEWLKQTPMNQDAAKYRVLSKGLSLAELTSIPAGAVMYEKQPLVFDRLRQSYLFYNHQRRYTRTNIYVEGADVPEWWLEKPVVEGFASMLARALCCSGARKNSDIYYAPDRGWDRYDGQNVIMFSQYDGKSLLERFGGLSALKNICDPYYYYHCRNVPITNRFNIVTGFQPYNDFLTDLCDGYEDEFHCIMRRFPIIVRPRKNECEVLVLRKFFDDKGDFSYCLWDKKTYEDINFLYVTDTIRPDLGIPFALCGNLRELVDACGDIKHGYSSEGKIEAAQSLGNMMRQTQTR